MFNYKGKKYELKKLTLGVKAVAIDILLEREELIHEATKDIDITGLRKYQLDKNRAETELLAIEKEGGDTSAVKKRIEDIDKRFYSDVNLQANIDLHNKKSNLAVTKLFMNEELIRKVVPAILTEKPELDFEDEDTLPFVTEVLGTFFIMTGKNLTT